MLDGVITQVEDISEEYFPDFRVHAVVDGRDELFRVWLRTDHNVWAVYGRDGRQLLSTFPTKAEAMSYIGRAAA